jgi:hypothetical protein
MNNKYERYINYIVNDIELPYLKYLEQYGLKDNEYESVLSKVYNQPVTIKSNRVFDSNGNVIYRENSNGYWSEREYHTNGNILYYEGGGDSWYKREFDINGNRIYYENSNGYWEKREYNSNGNQIYYETSDGEIIDKR